METLEFEPTAYHVKKSSDGAALEISNFNLWYGETQALFDNNLEIQKGQVTALIGPSGCGKSTLLRCLNRMNDLVDGLRIEGRITVDGFDIYARGVDVIALRKRMGMVFQKPNPFAMSIYDNITYPLRVDGITRKSILDETVERALQQAALWKEVKDRLHESALGLSGGQQQRLCIARAVARGICRSSLVKCSAFAGQAEWGRVAMAVGQVALERGFSLDPSTLRIEAEGICLYDGHGPSPTVMAAELKRRMRGSTVHWRIELGSGDASYTALGCDLSYDYVRINADEGHQVEVTRAGGIARNLSLAAYSPRLKHQLLVEGLAYVRRFTGLRAMLYLHPAAARSTTAASLGHDLELCLDAGLRPLAVVPDARSAEVIAEHMAQTGHYVTTVPGDPIAISTYLDRGHLCLMVREAPSPDMIVDLALKLGIQKLIALGNDQGLRDAHGFLQRLSPDTLMTGIQRGRFDSSDPDMLVLARQAAMRGVPAIHIIDARVPHAVVGELFTDQGIGTLVTRQALA